MPAGIGEICTSIVIPAYNAAPFIAETIESCLQQTLQDIEILVIDDGSTDSTASIVKSFQNPKIHYHYKKNSGVADTRNYGARLAKGEYLGFLDADDLFSPENVEKKIKALELHPETNVAYSAMLRFSKEKGDLDLVESHLGKGDETLEHILHFKSNVCPSQMIVRKKAFDDVGGYDTRLSTSADWDLAIRLAAKGGFHYLPEPLVRYRIHPNQMHHNIPLMENDVMTAFEKYSQSGIFRSEAEERLCRFEFSLILSASYLHIGKWNQSVYWGFTALRMHPLTTLKKIIDAARSKFPNNLRAS